MIQLFAPDADWGTVSYSRRGIFYPMVLMDEDIDALHEYICMISKCLFYLKFCYIINLYCYITATVIKQFNQRDIKIKVATIATLLWIKCKV